MLLYEQQATPGFHQSLELVPVCTLQVKVAEAEHEERARAARRRQAALNMEAQRAREQVQASAIVQAHTMPTLSCNVEQPICHPVPPEPDCIVLDPAAVQGMPGSGLVLFLVWHITERHQSCHTVLCVREQTWSSLLQLPGSLLACLTPVSREVYAVPGGRQAVWHNCVLCGGQHPHHCTGTHAVN